MYTMPHLGEMVLKGVNWVHIDKNQVHMVLKGVNSVHNAKSGQMVLKGVNWVHIAKIRSKGLERSQLSTL